MSGEGGREGGEGAALGATAAGAVASASGAAARCRGEEAVPGATAAAAVASAKRRGGALPRRGNRTGCNSGWGGGFGQRRGGAAPRGGPSKTTPRRRFRRRSRAGARVAGRAYPTCHRWEDRQHRALGCRRVESARALHVLLIDEHVDERTQLAAIVEHARSHAAMRGLQRCESLAHGRALYAHLARACGEGAQRSRNPNDDFAHGNTSSSMK